MSGTKSVGGVQSLKSSKEGKCVQQRSGQPFKIGQAPKEIEKQGQRQNADTGRLVSEDKKGGRRGDSGFQNIIAAAFANIPQQGKPGSLSRSSKKLALGKLAEYRDSQRNPSVDEEKFEKKKLEKFISENVRKAAIVTAEGRY